MPSLFRNGLSWWLQRLAACEAGTIETIVARAQAARLAQVFIQIADGADAVNAALGPDDPALHLTAAFHRAGISVWGWQTIYGDTPAFKGAPQANYHLHEAACATRQLAALRPAGLRGFALVADDDYERNPQRHTQAEEYMRALRAEFPDLPLGLSAWKYPASRPRFPWAAFRNHCDIDLPQIFWRGKHRDAPDQLQRSHAQYQALAPRLPYAPILPAFVENNWHAHPADLDAVLQQADALGLTATSFWLWDTVATHPDAATYWALTQQRNADLISEAPSPSEEFIALFLADADDELPFVNDTALAAADSEPTRPFSADDDFTSEFVSFSLSTAPEYESAHEELLAALKAEDEEEPALFHSSSFLLPLPEEPTRPFAPDDDFTTEFVSFSLSATPEYESAHEELLAALKAEDEEEEPTLFHSSSFLLPLPEEPTRPFGPDDDFNEFVSFSISTAPKYESVHEELTAVLKEEDEEEPALFHSSFFILPLPEDEPTRPFSADDDFTSEFVSFSLSAAPEYESAHEELLAALKAEDEEEEPALFHSSSFLLPLPEDEPTRPFAPDDDFTSEFVSFSLSTAPEYESAHEELAALLTDDTANELPAPLHALTSTQTQTASAELAALVADEAPDQLPPALHAFERTAPAPSPTPTPTPTLTLRRVHIQIAPPKRRAQALTKIYQAFKRQLDEALGDPGKLTPIRDIPNTADIPARLELTALLADDNDWPAHLQALAQILQSENLAGDFAELVRDEAAAEFPPALRALTQTPTPSVELAELLTADTADDLPAPLHALAQTLQSETLAAAFADFVRDEAADQLPPALRALPQTPTQTPTDELAALLVDDRANDLPPLLRTLAQDLHSEAIGAELAALKAEDEADDVIARLDSASFLLPLPEEPTRPFGPDEDFTSEFVSFSLTTAPEYASLNDELIATLKDEEEAEDAIARLDSSSFLLPLPEEPTRPFGPDEDFINEFVSFSLSAAPEYASLNDELLATLKAEAEDEIEMRLASASSFLLPLPDEPARPFAPDEDFINEFVSFSLSAAPEYASLNDELLATLKAEAEAEDEIEMRLASASSFLLPLPDEPARPFGPDEDFNEFVSFSLSTEPEYESLHEELLAHFLTEPEIELKLDPEPELTWEDAEPRRPLHFETETETATGTLIASTLAVATLTSDLSPTVSQLFKSLRTGRLEEAFKLYSPAFTLTHAQHSAAEHSAYDRASLRRFYLWFLPGIDRTTLVVFNLRARGLTTEAHWSCRTRAGQLMHGTDTFHVNRRGQITYHFTTLSPHTDDTT